MCELEKELCKKEGLEGPWRPRCRRMGNKYRGKESRRQKEGKKRAQD
jgi:hypothetical protein